MGVGERIRAIRTGRELTVRRLASLSGLSASLISQIETGKVDPSLSTLRKIAQSLGVPLFSLVLEGDAEPTQLVRLNDRRSIAFPKAGLHYEIIHSDTSKKMAVMIGTLQPHGATSQSLLNHPGEECLVILEGGLKVCVGESVMELTAGDSLYFDSSIPHRLCNDKKKPCRFYLIISPPVF